MLLLLLAPMVREASPDDDDGHVAACTKSTDDGPASAADGAADGVCATLPRWLLLLVLALLLRLAWEDSPANNAWWFVTA